MTVANPALTGKHLTGGEAGASWQGGEKRLTVRGISSGARLRIRDPMANAALTTTPTLITRQKENLGETQARGFELAGEWRVTPQIQVTGAYLQHSAELCSYAANPALVGNFLPQVLQNQFSFQASYLGMEWNAGLQGWFGGGSNSTMIRICYRWGGNLRLTGKYRQASPAFHDFLRGAESDGR